MTLTTAPAVSDRTRGFPRLLASGGPGLAAHLAELGPVPRREGLVDEIAASGLTGRGGAAFPVARKLAAMSPRGVVIGNGSEGEPLSAKDEHLLRQRPHLVLDGLIAIARAIGAKEAHLVVGAATESSVRSAIAERDDAQSVQVTVAPDRFVGGEASAVVNLLTTGNALPRDHAVRLTTRGLRGRSTLVQNVETLAHVALIARFGAAAFRALGADEDPGTRLFSVSGDVRRPGVTEGVGGTTLRSVVATAQPDGVRAVLVGGYHGTWVGPDALDAPLGVATMRGALPAGAGIVVVVGPHSCGLRSTAEITRYLAGESARQCGPCVNGPPALADLTERIARGDRDAGLPRRVEDAAALVQGRGACHHPDGTSRMVRSALRTFADDVEAHRHGRCTAVRR